MPHHERDGGPFASFDHRVSVAQVAGDRLLDKYRATLSRSGLDSWPVLGLRRSYNNRVEVTYAVKQGLDARISLCAQLLGDLRVGEFGQQAPVQSAHEASPHYAGPHRLHAHNSLTNVPPRPSSRVP